RALQPAAVPAAGRRPHPVRADRAGAPEAALARDLRARLAGRHLRVRAHVPVRAAAGRRPDPRQRASRSVADGVSWGLVASRRQINVGGIAIGGGAPVSIQSMTTTKTHDANATLERVGRLREAGADIGRVAVPGIPDA